LHVNAGRLRKTSETRPGLKGIKTIGERIFPWQQAGASASPEAAVAIPVVAYAPKLMLLGRPGQNCLAAVTAALALAP
jgi:hypothetical protein